MKRSKTNPFSMIIKRYKKHKKKWRNELLKKLVVCFKVIRNRRMKNLSCGFMFSTDTHSGSESMQKIHKKTFTMELVLSKGEFLVARFNIRKRGLYQGRFPEFFSNIFWVATKGWLTLTLKSVCVMK